MKDTDKKKKLIEKLPREDRIFLRRYGFNILSIIVVTAFIMLLQISILTYKSNYKPEEIVTATENESTINTVYHYYLDFSPSMEGFFKEGINSSMGSVSDALKEMNAAGNEKEFFCCSDRVVAVEENVLYENMENISGIRAYYNEIISSTGMNPEEEIDTENIKEAINKIDLAEIFYLGYEENKRYETGKESLNVIITDLNFKKSNMDEENPISDFARYFGEKCAESNVAVYQIYSRFAGITSDEYEWNIEGDVEYETSDELKPFFVFVESQNYSAYADFISKLDLKLNELGIDTSKKYELLNRVSDKKVELKIDVDDLKRNNRIEIKNFNYDNKSFESLKTNEMGLRMVQENGMSYLDMDICPIQLAGTYYVEGAVGGGMDIQVKTKVSYPIGQKKYEILENEILSFVKSNTIWDNKELYLTVAMEMNPDTAKMEMESVQKKGLFQENYFVIELQYFLEKPNYTLPEWIVNDEAIEDKIEVYEIMIANKEEVFSKFSEEQRYLGNTVVYITY